MIEKRLPTFWAEIAIAGSYEQAVVACREFCMEGLCVTVTRAEFVYTGGMESGALVRLINYPRFPADQSEILEKALRLADLLRIRLCQHSYSVITPSETVWRSWREA